MELGQIIASSYNEETGEVTLQFNEAMPEDYPNPVDWQAQNVHEITFVASIATKDKFPPALPTPPEE